MELKRKEFTFKGKNLEELKELGVREFSQMLNSRRKRTVLRNFQEHEAFLSRAKEKIDKKKLIRTHKRDIVVVPQMIGMKISIYNGNKFIPIEISGEMLGHCLGEFSLTRAKIKHEKKGTKVKSKK